MSTVTRWRREIGMGWQQKARKPSMPATTRPREFSVRMVDERRDISAPGLAADFLRRFGPVYRCDATGKASSKGKWWRRNFSVLSDEKIVMIARRLGWRHES